MIMEGTPIWVIDFEGSTRTGIVEYGVVELVLTKGIFKTMTHFCRSKQSIPLKDVQCHGISTEMTLREPPFMHEIPTFIQARQNGFFCAHNSIFENTMLNSYCPLPPCKYQLQDAPATVGWGPWLDTYYLYKHTVVRGQDYRLSSLIRAFNLESDLMALAERFCPKNRRRYHCALFDALASALLLLLFVRKHPHVTFVELLLQSASSIDNNEQCNQRYLNLNI